MSASTEDCFNPFNKLVLSALDGYFLVKPAEILYCRADDSYTHLYMQDGKRHTVSRQLKEFELLLAPHNFFRIHKSYLVNINHVDRITRCDSPSVVLSNNESLPIAYRKKEDFIERIKNL